MEEHCGLLDNKREKLSNNLGLKIRKVLKFYKNHVKSDFESLDKNDLKNFGIQSFEGSELEGQTRLLLNKNFVVQHKMETKFKIGNRNISKGERFEEKKES